MGGRRLAGKRSLPSWRTRRAYGLAGQGSPLRSVGLSPVRKLHRQPTSPSSQAAWRAGDAPRPGASSVGPDCPGRGLAKSHQAGVPELWRQAARYHRGALTRCAKQVPEELVPEELAPEELVPEELVPEELASASEAYRYPKSLSCSRVSASRVSSLPKTP